MTSEVVVKNVEIKEPSKEQLLNAFASFQIIGPSSNNPWSSQDIDKMESMALSDFRKVVEACRFFYRRDPLASTVINKMVDIGINDIVFSKNGISESEYKVYTALESKLREFAESMALEFLLSGLIVPEIKFAPVGREELKNLGIKRYETLTMPVSMWLRNPASIVINQTILSDKPSIYIEIPEDLIYFIETRGRYKDGSTDPKLYSQLVAYYPSFVQAVENKEKLYLIENNNVIRRKTTTESPYPIPYLYASIEPMKHKRNLRRMDYSIAARVISAIQLIRLGSDEFPLTELDAPTMDKLKEQMMWRNSANRDVERIFQLYGNHTLNISWVTPPVDALLNDAKYKDINQDIIFAMGFPRILITGETEKSNTSDAQFASISPVKTMDNFRLKITGVLQFIVNEVAKYNKFKNIPVVSFKPLQLVEFQTFVSAITTLYNTGNISRRSFADVFGFSWDDEMEDKIAEQEILDASDLPEFAPQAYSPQPGGNAPKVEKTEKPPKANKSDNKTEQN